MKNHCKYDELVELKVLKPHPKNHNKHSKDQVARLAKLYEYHGIRHPIIVSKLSNFIVAGHGRLLAAKSLKLKNFPVVYQNFKSSDAEYAFLQADNAIALWAELDLDAIKLDLPELSKDFDVDVLGIKDFVLDNDAPKGKCDEDEIPEKVPARTKPGDIYQLGKHRLMCGDSTSLEGVKRLMNGEMADMVFTDPPYGVSENTMRKSAGRGKLAENHDLRPIIGDDSTNTAIAAYKICEIFEIPLIFIWGANYYAKSLPEISSWVIWDKRDGVASDDNADCELAWSNRGGPARVFSHLWKGCIRASEKSESKVHPTQKPVALAEWAIKEYPKNKVISVLDLFGGSGSTLIACEKTGRSCFMMELDPHYCDVIVARWEKYTGNKAVLVSKEIQMRKKKKSSG